jgi:hypothetical protein
MASTHFPFLYAALPYEWRKELMSIHSGLAHDLQLTASLASAAFFALGCVDMLRFVVEWMA